MPKNKLPRLREPHGEPVQQVRDLFMKNYRLIDSEEERKQAYYDEDVRQVETMSFLVQRCVIIKRKQVDEAYKMLDAMLRWRRKHFIRELTDRSFAREFFLCGAAFVYEPDVFGNKTLYVRPHLLRNVLELKQAFKEFLAYLIYRIDDSVDGASFALIFDLSNTLWQHYDFDMLMHLLSLLRDYYPVNIDYVLAINFPWILTAAWTVVKRLIPPERRDVVAFVSSKDVVNNFVKPENLPDFLGGTCARPHQYTPKNCKSIVELLLEWRELARRESNSTNSSSINNNNNNNNNSTDNQEPQTQHSAIHASMSDKRIAEIIKVFDELVHRDDNKFMHDEFERLINNQ
ncbi:Motile sperm domain-containing protein 2 [Fragariocoptes setiger]|uniref:Motile sperm domain-containing protein 2 n=1 Tax=Fragariocoptes setiger TaxID=1670756 RepID=A0ABQ7S9K9_9ACAR|nr:Motile sperm domain-containing protein 2 [Fragariocoptes setiger]